MSQSSLAELNKNPSSPKRVHFINSIIILNKEDEAKEEGSVESSVTEYRNHEMTIEDKEEVESEEEFEEGTKEETKEEENDNPLEPRRKPSNPKKNCNFVGRVKGLKVFVGMLEDTTGVIDHDLGSVIFGKPFVEATRLVYDVKEETIVFEKDKEKIMFKMPHKIEMFEHIDFTNIRTDHIPPFVIRSDDDNSEKTHYSDNFDLGPEYKYDENVCRAIRSLIAINGRRNKGEVT
ncbi:hypothetical protein Tco_1100497 [Tanacetum coccineum]